MTDQVQTGVSVIILTKNEAINIPECLKSVAWSDDIIVVDSESSDGTPQIAREARPDVRVFFHPFIDFGDQRNWALDHSQPRHEWILFVDADERITPACLEAIQEAITNPGERVGFFLAPRNLFLGRWLRRCTFYPSWQLRLLKHGQVRFQKEGHGQREMTSGPLGYIHKPYDHFPFSKGVQEWIARHNVYSTNEVELILRLRAESLNWADMISSDAVRRRRFLKRLAAHAPALLRPFLRFFYTYVLRGGFLDGRAGWVFCMLRLSHESHIGVKLHEARARSTP